MGVLFSTFGIDWHLLTAQVINFVILAIALTWFLYKPVLKIIRERASVIAKGIADAEASTALLATADGKAKERVDTAEAEASQIVERARHAAVNERTNIMHEAEERAARVAADAEARAKEIASQSLRESEQEIARLALLAAEKVMRQKA